MTHLRRSGALLVLLASLAGCSAPPLWRDDFWGKELLAPEGYGYEVERDAWGRPVLPQQPQQQQQQQNPQGKDKPGWPTR